jgi:hypothetical protein
MKTRLLMLAALIFVSSCSSTGPVMVSKDHDLATLRTAYVVSSGKNLYSGTSIAEYIKEALVEHGVTALSGTLENKPMDVDFYVTYVDRWQWDLAMYLSSLEINFFDNKSGQLIAKGHYAGGVFHTYPKPVEKTKEIISSIYLRSRK